MAEVVRAWDASTVMVLRETHGLEVLCVRRSPRLRTWGGAVAFPGGQVEESDWDQAFERCSTALHPRTREVGPGEASGRAMAVAAVRELMEEVSILPVVGGMDESGVKLLRGRCTAGEAFVGVVEGMDVVLDLGALIPVARWATPRWQDRRFDARFFVMKVPEGQFGFGDGEETMDCFWMAPRKIMDMFERGALMLVPPTQWMLNMLSNYEYFSDVARFAESQSLRRICPELVSRGSVKRLVLPGDPDHVEQCKYLEGPTSFDLIDGRFVLNWKT